MLVCLSPAVALAQATRVGFLTQPSTSTAGVSISPAVRVAIQDPVGTTVTTSTAPVTLAISTNPGGGTLSGTLTVNAVAGIATFSNLSIDKVGTGYRLQATSPGLSSATSITFNINAAAANKLAFTTPTRSFTAGQCAGAASVITVQLQDAFGNAVAAGAGGLAITASSTSTGTVNWYTDATCTTSAGAGAFTIAAGTNTRDIYYTDTKAGTPSISLTNGSGLTNPAPQAQTVTAFTANRVSFIVQPASTTAGSPINPAVQVAVQDQYNNTVTSSTASITVAIGTNPGGGTLSGTTTVAAVAGVASFSDLSIDKAGTGYTLTGASAGLTGATSTAFNINPGAASRLAFTTQPTSATAGVSLSPAVHVTVQDAFGNTVTSSTASITVAIGTNPGGGALSGTTTVAAVAGVATFSNLSVDKAGTGYTLTAASSPLTGATSSTFNITAAAAAKVAFTVQPTNATAGVSISPAVQVAVQDAFGNTVTGSTASITVAIGSNPGGGTLSGTTTASASGGVATFSNLSIDKAGTGYTLSATSSGLTGGTSAG
ncbi:MAG TPA: hemagglutinin, partial [Myxococcaceae bacterium]|nr:hemagglutinin [Myxococcaceae bacterium]